MGVRARRQAQYAALRDTQAVSLDGQRVAVQIKAGLLVELPHLAESGADGIGLYRTEFQFMVSAALPRMREQLKTYRAVLEAAGERSVVFRSLDIGGDKVMPFLRQTQEENPALGWRAIRMALDRPGLMRTQIRALLHAAAGGTLRLMFPMVSAVDEFERARALVEQERQFLLRHGHTVPADIKLGAMVEVPSLLFQLDELLNEVDFISVGSNDLLQFLWACDRGNVRMAGRFDPLTLPVLRVLKNIAERAEAHGKPVTLCGELASRPLEAMVLLGLGYRSISMAPPSVAPVKAMVLKLHIGTLEERLNDLMSAGKMSLREDMIEFAQAHQVPCG